MKTYKKPTIEVISMRTSENIADNNLIKTIYTRAANATDGTYTELPGAATYNPETINGSNV